MNSPVYTNDDADAMFDSISYERGSCIIRMMSDILGEETFQKGLKRYLDARYVHILGLKVFAFMLCNNAAGLLNDSFKYFIKRAFNNAVEDDLWQALQLQADEDNVALPASMKVIMETWTSQMGYPVITVTRNYGSNSTVVSQVQFFSMTHFQKRISKAFLF